MVAEESSPDSESQILVAGLASTNVGHTNTEVGEVAAADKPIFHFLKKKTSKNVIPTNKVDWSNVKARTVNRIDAKIEQKILAPPKAPIIQTAKLDLTKVKKRVDNRHDEPEFEASSIKPSSVKKRASMSSAVAIKTPHTNKKQLRYSTLPQHILLESINLAPVDTSYYHEDDDSANNANNFMDQILRFEDIKSAAAEERQDLNREKREEVNRLDSVLLSIEEEFDALMNNFRSSRPLVMKPGSTIAIFDEVPEIVCNIAENPLYIGVIEGQIEKLKSAIHNDAGNSILSFVSNDPVKL